LSFEKIVAYHFVFELRHVREINLVAIIEDKMSSHRRFLELDGLRGLAALAVVLYHYLYHYNSLFGHSFAIPDFLWIGYYGVHFFFMISGFVIFWTISRTTKALDFIWSRFSRLYPVYWAALSLTFIFVALFSLAGHKQNSLLMLIGSPNI
jgi:peptidoglycan/LPS O-acetylase OafA/YrhL